VVDLRWRAKTAGGQRGFTLMEIIISLAILAVALTAVMQAFSGGLRATTASERQASAILLARSLLDRVGRDVALVPGEQSGVTEEGYRWLVRIQPAQVIDAERVADSPLLPYDVQVQVAGGGRSVTLTTLRLASVVFEEEIRP
jgi:prepilin-type N-terminal cleavage/methylation domain-containing protein